MLALFETETARDHVTVRYGKSPQRLGDSRLALNRGTAIPIAYGTEGPVGSVGPTPFQEIRCPSIRTG
jgi:hypothetical protein